MALDLAASFDESGSTVIDYANGLNFPMTASITRVAGHGTGNAVQANGSTPVPLPTCGVADQRTVMAWIKGDITTEDSWIVEWHVDAEDTGAWGILSLQGDIVIQAENGSTQARASAPWSDITGWHHVAGTFDGSMVCLYIDGELVDCTPLSGPIRTDSDAPTLLGRGDTPAVDDLRVYSHCLDLQSVNAAKAAIVVADNFTSSAALAVDADFISRVTAAVAHYALSVAAEFLATDQSNQAAKVRFQLARSVLLEPEAYGAKFAWAIAADAGVDGTVDDASISQKIADAWPVFAGL
ncbi:LamG domain-containing protein [Amycolatopsis kentuckyensis]|uniref:LamG domain-containing protein n=1 Tax=Amycolatopsis kentuckyensis TaxID=218823 RepID=UPI000A3B8CE0|nr:LamG domain-containing protein [Amycolatopsis kentuckyensis]